MKNLIKGSMVAAAMLMGASSFAQIQDEKNVTITMELVPILQLNMNTPDQVNFVFDEISEYIGGITKYGATILTASSSVSWDLFASGTSGAHAAAPGSRIWDAQAAYGTAPITNAAGGAWNQLPLTALELHQFPGDINNGVANTGGDYAAQFTAVPNPQVATLGANNIYVSLGSAYVAPPAVAALNNRYIGGGSGLTSFVAGGSYLTQTAVAANGAPNAYYFVVDYRIVPGLPTNFPFASTGTAPEALAGAGSYAKPGVYTMNVKYLMIENQ
jgi:hypothetical protein